METLPKHLRKYIVNQSYGKYTSVDQACWRFVLRQLRDFLSTNAHEIYLEGLEKTGITIDEIPRIEDISAKLEKYGWRALPVSGFIPPAAFMELQSLGVLPIASDMRTLEHLTYTPAPDIVHEAAGHAPILIHPEFAAYLKNYSQVARKAIISSEDLAVYTAIRDLSDIKENPQSTSKEIESAQKKLEDVTKAISHISEATQVSRMNWWTAEYGLIGSLTAPKIYGAGLLSSMAESQSCLSEKVKKVPISLKTVETTYDITEQQPQLFVTPNFETLSVILNEFSESMAFKVGGAEGLAKAIQAKTVNTIELDSGLQVSGQIVEFSKDVSYLKFSGPCQLSYKNHELLGHGRDYHSTGFSTPLGRLKNHPQVELSQLSRKDLQLIGISEGDFVSLEFESGIKLEGKLLSILTIEGKSVLWSLANCTVTSKGSCLFDPSWGVFDLAIGEKVISVFGGPADREAFGEHEEFVAKRIPQIIYNEKQKLQQIYFDLIRKARRDNVSEKILIQQVEKVFTEYLAHESQEWLLLLECYELVLNRTGDVEWQKNLKKELEKRASKNPKIAHLISDGLRLSSKM